VANEPAVKSEPVTYADGSTPVLPGARELAASARMEKPRAVDWFAGTVAIVLKLGMSIVVIAGIAAAIALLRRCA
jgi:hypothetical protein